VMSAAVEHRFERPHIERPVFFAAPERGFDLRAGTFGSEVKLGSGEGGDRDPVDERSVLVAQRRVVNDESLLTVAWGRGGEVECAGGTVSQQPPEPTSAVVAGDGW